MPLCPFAQGFGLDGGFGILGRCHMVNDRLDSFDIKNPVLTTAHKVVDGDRRRDLMTHYHINIKNRILWGGRIPQMGRKDLFSNSIAHYLIHLRRLKI